MKSLLKSSTVTLVFLLTLFVPFLVAEKAHAQTGSEIFYCKPDESIFTQIGNFLSKSISQTTTDSLVSGAAYFPAYLVFGSGPKEVFSCVKHIQNVAPDILQGVSVPADCDPDPQFCNDIFAIYEDYAPTSPVTYNNRYNGTPIGAGSIVYMANRLEKGLEEPLPVNLAYYFDKKAEGIPVIGKAYAQSSDDYSGPFLDIIYTFTVFMRDIALGLMAVIMIFVGILIMTQKKVNPQTIVTVQYAIPRIVIALILITFSYPIGATIASFAWALRSSMQAIIYNLVGQNGDLGTVGIYIAYFYKMVQLWGGVGFFFVFSSMGIIAGVIIFRLIVSIKLLFVYLKMLVQIIGAPLRFAISAVPGQEEQMSGWFKHMLVYTGAILGMRTIMAITDVALILLVISMGSTTTGNPGEILGLLAMGFLAPTLIVIFGYSQALKVPKMLEETFLGAGGKKR